MQRIILAIIGLGALWFVVRLLWREAKGEHPCSCGNCAGKKCFRPEKK